MKLSVIVPTHNSAALIDACLGALRKEFKGELIVVDGGSQDGTTAKAMAYRAVIFQTGLNFAQQCNEGAKEAMGDVLFFLSPQAEVLEGCLEEVEEALASEYVVGGGLRPVWQDKSLRTRVLSFGQNFGSRCLDVALSPQGIFVRRDIFLNVGGFATSAVLPHLWLAQRLKEYGEFRYLDAPIRVLGRPLDGEPIIATTLGFVRAFRQGRDQNIV